MLKIKIREDGMQYVSAITLNADYDAFVAKLEHWKGEQNKLDKM